MLGSCQKDKQSYKLTRTAKKNKTQNHPFATPVDCIFSPACSSGSLPSQKADCEMGKRVLGTMRDMEWFQNKR